MSIRRKAPQDSLYMLLDTMCNAFGGIILLAVLVTLLTSKEREASSGSASETQEMLQRRLSIAEGNLEQSRNLLNSLQGRITDDRLKQQVALLTVRNELRQSVEVLREAVTKSEKEIDAASAADPAARLKSLNSQLSAAEIQKVQRQNELNAALENSKRLKQRLADLDRQILTTLKQSERPLRLPREHATGKRPFYVILQYGAVYPCRNADLSRNNSSISWSEKGDGETANPIPGRGRNARDLQVLFSNLPKELVYVVFCVFEDSFAEFNRAKESATANGLAYGWEPFRNEARKVTFSSKGHTPNPQ